MAFDITDSKNRYQACPMCRAQFGMGIMSRQGHRFVQCQECGQRGQETPLSTADSDRLAFEAWNALSCDTAIRSMDPLVPGKLVRWEWVDVGMGADAIAKGIRPVGIVVDKTVMPHMACELGVQLLDDKFWIIDPVFFFSKGRCFYV